MTTAEDRYEEMCQTLEEVLPDDGPIEALDKLIDFWRQYNMEWLIKEKGK